MNREISLSPAQRSAGRRGGPSLRGFCPSARHPRWLSVRVIPAWSSRSSASVREEHIDLVPREQEVRGLAVQLRAVDAEDVPRGAPEHDLLLLDDGRLRIPEPAANPSLRPRGRPRRSSKTPGSSAPSRRAAWTGGGGAARRVWKTCTPGIEASISPDRQIRRDDRDRRDRMLAKRLGEREDGGARNRRNRSDSARRRRAPPWRSFAFAREAWPLPLPK